MLIVGGDEPSSEGSLAMVPRLGAEIWSLGKFQGGDQYDLGYAR